MTEDEQDLYRIKSVKPYEDIGPLGEIPNYHWRVQDFVNALIATDFSIQKMVEFHSEKDVHDCWCYATLAKAETDNYKMADWRLNPWAALPQWMGFRAGKI